jgi:hypothetical protein
MEIFTLWNPRIFADMCHMCWVMYLHMEVCCQTNISLWSLKRIKHWSRFASNRCAAFLRDRNEKILGTVGSCVRERARESQNVTASVRGWENTLEHHNQVRREEEGETISWDLTGLPASVWRLKHSWIGIKLGELFLREYLGKLGELVSYFECFDPFSWFKF